MSQFRKIHEMPAAKVAVLGALVLVCLGATAPEANGPGLAEYLARPQPQAGWTKRSGRAAKGVRHIRVELVSQVWQEKPWRHELDVLRPLEPEHPGVALLFVTAGRGWFGGLSAERRLAVETGVTVAVLADVPNQPLFGRTEDDLIAFTFEQYLRTADPEWPLLYPMTKSVVQAMNAIQELARSESSHPIDRFVVTGISKRGWTSWLSAASDLRVAGVVPLVFDNLSFGPQLENQLAVWGRYSEQIGDYTGRGLPALMATKRGRELVAQVDPHAHRETLERTRKLIVNGTNDPYWELGALNLYWNELGGEKSVLYVPNTGHSAGGSERVAEAMAGFVRRVARGEPMPTFQVETVAGDASIELEVAWSEPPADARLWYAASPRRDFRSARWQSIPARLEGSSAMATVEREDAFVAIFGEAAFRSAERTFRLTTTVDIIGEEG